MLCTRTNAKMTVTKIWAGLQPFPIDNGIIFKGSTIPAADHINSGAVRNNQKRGNISGRFTSNKVTIQMINAIWEGIFAWKIFYEKQARHRNPRTPKSDNPEWNGMLSIHPGISQSGPDGNRKDIPIQGRNKPIPEKTVRIVDDDWQYKAQSLSKPH